MRLLVIIPAFNEGESIGEVLSRIPRKIRGITISSLVIDDGSTDDTVSVSKTKGAKVVRHPKRLGLAAAFRTGLKAALKENPDLIATIDADGQYKPEELKRLLECMELSGADLVVGDRQIRRCGHMPAGNRFGNVLGSAMLRLLAGIQVNDASSGFRLFSSKCARSMRITSKHTYTHEMLIQAKAYGFKIANTPVTFLPRSHGRSKLVRTLRHHIYRSCGTILKAIFLYHPLTKFLSLAFLSFFLAVLSAAGIFVSAAGSRPVFIVATAAFLLAGLQFAVLGILADSVSSENRMLLEDPVKPSS